MKLVTNIPDVMENAARYFMLHGAEIPEYQRQKIIEVMGPGISPVDFVVRLAEALYAVSDSLDTEGRTLAAQAANLAAINGWHGMAIRGNQIVNALRRMEGEEVAQLDSEDPKPLETVLVPPEPLQSPTPPPAKTPTGE